MHTLLLAVLLAASALQDAAARLATLSAAAAENPYDGGRVRRLAFALREAGALEESEAAFARVLEVAGESWADLWNLACVQVARERYDEALVTLERSLRARHAEPELLLTDEDMVALHDHAGFRELTGLFPDPDLDRDGRWRHDLVFLGRRMEWMHWDLYAKVSRAEFQGELAALAEEVPELAEWQIRTRLRRLIARVGDGHTLIRGQPEGAASVPRIPLDLYLFADGLHVCGAPAEHAELVGGRVLALGPIPVEQALRDMRGYVSVDNEMGYRDWAPGALTSTDVLGAIGALVPGGELDVAVERDGRRVTRSVAPVEGPPRAASASGMLGRTRADGWIYADAGASERPLYLQRPDEDLWFTDLPEQRLVYAWFGAVDHPHDPPGGTFEGFCRELFAHVEASGAERLVLDMRLNGGGNTGVVLPLIHGLVRCEAVNRPGGLFVITGRRTFSAAMNTCSLLELHTAATFVGEPTGSRPNFVGESTSFVLPCTRYRVFCSSRYWQHVSSTDVRPWIAPAIAAEPTFADWAAGRDPVMEAILARAGTR